MAEITTLAEAVAEVAVHGVLVAPTPPAWERHQPRRVPGLRPRDRERALIAMHRGVTVDEVRAATGWDPGIAGPLSVTSAPADPEMVALRAMRADIER